VRLEALDAAEGYSGFAQRVFKGSMQQASQVPHAVADSPWSGAGGGQIARGRPAIRSGPGGRFGLGGMGGFAGPVAAPAPLAAAAPLAEADEEIRHAAETIRQVGNRAFYLRQGQWIDSTVTENQQKTAVHVKQFSDEYFALVRRHGRALSQYMVFDEPLIVNVADRTYLIEP